MKKFLTSILAIGFAMPAMADITAQSTCDTNALGQSDNNSTANVEASWTPIQYSEPAGQYLLFANDTITQHTTCPAGSFCVGFSNQAFTDSSMGIQSCPTGYTNSAAGATAQGQCYNPGTATCSTRNPYSGANPSKTSNIVYGNSTNGSASCKTYYGSNECALDIANACEITDITCATGYRKERVAVAGASNPLASVDVSIDGDHNYGKGYYNNGDYCWTDGTGSTSNCSSAPFTTMSRNDWQTEFSYGTVKGRASCNNTNIDETVMADLEARMEAGTLTEEEAMAIAYAPGGAFSQPSNAFNSNSEGQYCWCQTESFTPTGGSTVGASSSWVFSRDYGSASDCAYNCAGHCANGVRYNRGFRGALFGSVGETSLQCVANTINIDWDPQNGESHTTNQCTYDGAITLPTEPSKTGYTFGGWRLKTN